MRVLHTSDWHLGDRLGLVDRTQDQLRAIDRVLGYCDEYRVDVLLVAGDRAVRSESDLPNSARVLGVMPQLKLKLRRIPKSARRDAMRRAIGFAAGTALPAPGGSK